MILAIRHIGIVVSNLEVSLNFYEKLLGLQVVKLMEEAGEYINNMLVLKDVNVTTIKLAAPDGNLIELLYFHSHPRKFKKIKQACDIGITHFAIAVDDLNEEYNRLLKAGIKFNAPPQQSPDGYAKVTFCRDPDENLIELVQVLQ